jgi:hypothetical protein
MSDKWKKIDDLLDSFSYLEGADCCYYARERIARAKWDACETNGLIHNFKMEPSIQQQNPHRWKHKCRAADQFAQELERFIPRDRGMWVAHIPTSKVRGDPEFDPRFDLMFERLRAYRKDLTFCEPIVRDASRAAVHTLDQRPSFEEVLGSFRFAGFDGHDPPKHLVFIDDVLTTGKHYSACRRLARENCPGIHVYGVFWAKTIWPAPTLELPPGHPPDLGLSDSPTSV